MPYLLTKAQIFILLPSFPYSFSSDDDRCIVPSHESLLTDLDLNIHGNEEPKYSSYVFTNESSLDSIADIPLSYHYHDVVYWNYRSGYGSYNIILHSVATAQQCYNLCQIQYDKICWVFR